MSDPTPLFRLPDIDEVARRPLITAASAPAHQQRSLARAILHFAAAARQSAARATYTAASRATAIFDGEPCLEEIRARDVVVVLLWGIVLGAWMS